MSKFIFKNRLRRCSFLMIKVPCFLSNFLNPPPWRNQKYPVFFPSKGAFLYQMQLPIMRKALFSCVTGSEKSKNFACGAEFPLFNLYKWESAM
jgi:hypothetical protein